ncbi:MAG TPA: response regulator [Polyangiaceae bacterium]|nr:response regulator [Polyangiaceae bacterium]
MSKRILVVDDSKAMRLIVRRTLRQAGFGDYEVEEACNGLEAISAIENARPDLILSDWNMPEMNGYELLKALRAKKNDVRLGFVTTESTPEMQAMANEAGALFLIAKPFTAEQFQAALKPFLG